MLNNVDVIKLRVETRVCRWPLTICDRLENAVKVLAPSGRVAEWLKAPDSKSGVRVTVPWVQIPPLPPNSLSFSQPAPAQTVIAEQIQRAENLWRNSPKKG